MRYRNRGESTRYALCSVGQAVGMVIKGWIPLDAGEKMVREDRAGRIFDPDTGKLKGYLLTSSNTDAGHYKKPVGSLQASEAVLSKNEVDAIVGEAFKGGVNLKGEWGAPGKSRTAGLSAHERSLREALGYEDIDLQEQARYKLNAFDPRHGRRVVAAQ